MELTLPPVNGCLPWHGYVGKNGYGYFGLACQVTVLAHRFGYTVWRRPVPAKLHLDHQCHNQDLTCPGGKDCRHRRCVYPWSLRARTQSANLLAANMTRPRETHRNGRKDECPAGHLYDEENTYWWSGMRTCKACRRIYQRALRAVKRGDYPSMAIALTEYGYYPLAPVNGTMKDPS
jgi:hypothetical protein